MRERKDLLMVHLEMNPPAGRRMVTHAGDVVTFELRVKSADKAGLPKGWEARLRTNLGRAECFRQEVVLTHYGKLPLAGASWRDLPMVARGDRWVVTVPLTEVGYFQAKPYVLDESKFQHWPDGPDVGVHVEPSWTRTANTVYCAFPRMFGKWSKSRPEHQAAHQTPEIMKLDKQGFVVIPPSGTLRDVQRELPHILDKLGCRIVHLLPVGPTPTTFARFGRFGSPYAVQDLTAIDPALVEFDQRTTGVQQFEELARAIHAKGSRLFLDIVINHTGWGSREWNDHPDWFLRKKDGRFECPGAWGVVWEDLVEFDQRHVPLWDYLANAFLTWCQRGVDGFRCDAGYKVPVHVWQYITARVRQEFPDTVFFLEGLGGPWDATEALLTVGGMQWAYSELFQNMDPVAIHGYLDHALKASAEVGVLVNYSETHDNSRLAAHPKGLAWSRYRNLLCALTSVSGGYGFTCGVEWGATEQIQVHSSRGLNWGAPENLMADLAAINELLAEHPCFFDGARLSLISPPGASVCVLRRDSKNGDYSMIVILNLDAESVQNFELPAVVWQQFGAEGMDLLPQGALPTVLSDESSVDCHEPSVVLLQVGAAAVHCLVPKGQENWRCGIQYRCERACADWGLRVWVEGWKKRWGDDDVPKLPKGLWHDWAQTVFQDAEGFLAASLGAVRDSDYRRVVVWTMADTRRIVPVPPGHWLLVRDDVPFRARLMHSQSDRLIQESSIRVSDGHIAAFPPTLAAGEAALQLERYQPEAVGDERQAGQPSKVPGFSTDLIEASLRYLSREPVVDLHPRENTFHGPVVLLTNGRGGMSRIPVDLGRTTSKYDCVLGANLHPNVPVDRHVLVKRLRVWVNADGFITPLNAVNLSSFEPGPPAHWRFVANAGNGRSVEIHLVADMVDGQNAVLLEFTRPHTPPQVGRPLPSDTSVRLTVRLDLEDRNFHWETKRNPAAEAHFESHCRVLEQEEESPEKSKAVGFVFRPDPERAVTVSTAQGSYHPAMEWAEWLPHSVEATRGMEGSGDGWSPGWFDLPLIQGEQVTLSIHTEETDSSTTEKTGFVAARVKQLEAAYKRAGLHPADAWGRQLVTALQAFVVRRDEGRTVIAGYPWFLDWGRDSLIAARGLRAAGMAEEVRALVLTFARFEEKGTLPNSIHGEDASNRDTSDAPLWFGIVCEELAQSETERPESTGLSANDGGRETSISGASDPKQASRSGTLFENRVGDSAGRTVRDVLRSIACGYLQGTKNGIWVDPNSCLVWSPSHFTWMDTNHPAGTPREGYPVEIQVLWIRLLQLLDRLGANPWEGDNMGWAEKARSALESFESLFWLEKQGWYSDCLLASPHLPASEATPSDALRSNALLAVALDISTGERARRTVVASLKHLLVPGALRSLAPLPVQPPMPILGNQGQLLNDPNQPYWGRYEGDEDTRRKPAYHNGTAWGWTFPSFCEALVKAFPDSSDARDAAQAYLGSMDAFLAEGCLGQMPEVVDGDAPHTHRGCDAQAWTVSEALRVWRWLVSLE